jgi:nicotinamidase-related amidase
MRNILICLLFAVVDANFFHRAIPLWRLQKEQDLEQDDIGGDFQMLRTKKPEVVQEGTEPREEPPRSGGTTLFLIHVQNCMHQDLNLPMQDSLILTELIYNHTDKIDRILATVSTRDLLHISHPHFWINDDGFHPAPFTQITSQDVNTGKYVPNPRMRLSLTKDTFDEKYFKQTVLDDNYEFDLFQYTVSYLQQLEASNRFNHSIWPQHCLVGTEGSSIVEPVMEALLKWTEDTGKSVEWMYTPRNQLTEMTSILRANVVISQATSYNYDWLETLLLSERLLVAGQTKSHAVNWSMRDLLLEWPHTDVSRIQVIVDTMSPMDGFETEAGEFEMFLKEAGVELVTARNVFL